MKSGACSLIRMVSHKVTQNKKGATKIIQGLPDGTFNPERTEVVVTQSGTPLSRMTGGAFLPGCQDDAVVWHMWMLSAVPGTE